MICVKTLMLRIRFNRDIVECKVSSFAKLTAILVCFNRDIVECKEIIVVVPLISTSVLIET